MYNFDISMGTPKFKEEDSLPLDDNKNMTFYARKREKMQAKKELFAMENYRSETTGQRPN